MFVPMPYQPSFLPRLCWDWFLKNAAHDLLHSVEIPFSGCSRSTSPSASIYSCNITISEKPIPGHYLIVLVRRSKALCWSGQELDVMPFDNAGTRGRLLYDKHNQNIDGTSTDSCTWVNIVTLLVILKRFKQKNNLVINTVALALLFYFKTNVLAKEWLGKCCHYSAPDESTIVDWRAEYKRDRTITDEAPRSGRPN